MNKQGLVYEKQLTQAKLTAFRKAAARYITQPIVQLLSRTRLSPDDLTWVGFLIIVVAAALLVFGQFIAAGFVVLAASFFDMLDGALARSTDRVTKYGSVLDSTLDRAAEALLFTGVMAFYALNSLPHSTIIILAAGVAMTTSFLVSYVRARAEGAGLKCEVGLLTRAERIILLVLGLWLSRVDYALVIALCIIALLSLVTVGQRLVCVWRQTRINNPGAE